MQCGIVVFAVVVAIKLVLVGAVGPVFTPDSPGYVGLAETMRGSTNWLHDAGLSTGADAISYRMIGYPAVIAAAMSVAGPAWVYVVIVLQSLLSFAAGWALYRLAIELGLPWRLSIAAVAAFLLSFQLTLDQAVLTDSLNASFFCLAVCSLARGAAARRPLTAGAAASAGLFLVLAFLLREALQFLAITLAPLLIVRIWLAGHGWWIRSALAGLLALAPLVATIEIYKAWNFYRTGERFVTTIPSLTITHGIAEAAKFNPSVIAGDTPLERTARATFKHYTYDEVITLNGALFAAGYKATDISRMAYAHYFELWRSQPLAMLSVLRLHISERAAKLTIRPLGAICETIELATEERRCYDYRDLYRAAPAGFSGLPWSAPAFFVVRTIELTLAICLFLGFLVGVPCHVAARVFAHRSSVDGAPLVIGAFWLMYLAWFIAFGIVTFGDRYMMPVLPFSIVAGIYVWRGIFLRLRAGRLSPRQWASRVGAGRGHWGP